VGSLLGYKPVTFLTKLDRAERLSFPLPLFPVSKFHFRLSFLPPDLYTVGSERNLSERTT
jgi:hypothetical protein